MLEKLEIINNLKIEKIFGHQQKIEEALRDVQKVSAKYEDLATLINMPTDSTYREYHKVRDRLDAIKQAFGISRLYVVSLETEIIFPNRLIIHENEVKKIKGEIDSTDLEKLFYKRLTTGVFRRSLSSNQYYYAITTPLYNDKEILNSVLMCEIPMDGLYQTIHENSGLGTTGESMLIWNNKSNVEIISPRRGFEFVDTTLSFSKNKNLDFPVASIFKMKGNRPPNVLTEVEAFDDTEVDMVWRHIPKSEWGLVTRINHSESFEAVYQLRTVIVGLCAGILLITIVLINVFVKQILYPIKQIGYNIVDLSEGRFPSAISYPYNDEIKAATNALNILVRRIRKATIVSDKLSKGDKKLMKRLKITETDVLSNSLLNLKNRLNQLEKEAERSEWFASGLSVHSEIIHKNSNDIHELGERLISSLSTYINVQAGSVFALEKRKTEDRFKLIGTYAVDVDKAPSYVLSGQGLVGQCAADGKLIYVDKAPSDYLSVSSGLGKVSTIKLLIVPLQVGGEIVGMLEFASIESIPTYKIEFVEKLAENIAYSIKVVQKI